MPSNGIGSLPPDVRQTISDVADEILSNFVVNMQGDDCEPVTEQVQGLLQTKLDLRHMSKKSINDILMALSTPTPTTKVKVKTSKKSRPNSDPATISEWQRSHLIEFLAEELIGTDQARRAFDLLDIDGKQFVCLQDLQRAASKLLLGDEMNDDALIEMIQEYEATGDGHGILTRDDIIRIARDVNL
jgi:Ca2+-binding EF-hand superfamily protein